MSSSTQSLFKKIALRVLYTIIGFHLFILIFSPVISFYFLSDYLENEFDLSLGEETSIRLNLFTSHLSIDNLSMTKIGKSPTENVFELKRLDAEIRLHRLFVQQLYVSELSMDGLFLLADKEKDLLRISGVDIPTGESKVDSGTQEKLQSSEPSSFEVILPNYSFAQSKITARLDGVAHTLEIGQIFVKQLLFSEKEQNLSLSIESAFDSAPLTFDAQVSLKDFKGLITSNFDLSGFDLKHMAQFLPSTIKALDGEVSISNTSNINLTDSGITVKSKVSEFKLDHLVFENEQLKASQKQFQLALNDLNASIGSEGEIKSEVKDINIAINDIEVNKERLLVDVSGINSKVKNLKVKLPKSESLSLELESESEITKLAAYAGDRDHLLARFDALDVGDVSLQLAKAMNVQIKELGVTNGVYSKIVNSEEKDTKGMFGFNRFAINEFKFDEQLMSIDNVRLSGIYGDINIGKDGQLKNSVSLSPENESLEKDKSLAVKEEINETPTEVKEPIKITVKNIEVVDSDTIRFLDESISPAYKRDVFLDEVTIKNLDSSAPQSESPFIIRGRSDKYTKIDFKGFVKPFTKKLNAKLAGSFTEISLPPASSYIREALTFDFESGELDTHIDLEIEDAIIGGSTLIKIRGMALASAENHDQDVLQEQTSLPLNVALGMLKDSDDNVELDIPMYGDIDSPVFGFSSFIGLITKKAVQSAATDYLMTTFVPYANVVSLTISAADFLMKLRFEDLPYENGQSEISQPQMEYMNQFVALMKDKKDAQVKVCAISTFSDIENNGSFSDSQNEEETKKYVLKLKELSSERMERFKEYVVEQSIESNRILLCSPKVDLTPETKPVISISV